MHALCSPPPPRPSWVATAAQYAPGVTYHVSAGDGSAAGRIGRAHTAAEQDSGARQSDLRPFCSLPALQPQHPAHGCLGPATFPVNCQPDLIVLWLPHDANYLQPILNFAVVHQNLP